LTSEGKELKGKIHATFVRLPDGLDALVSSRFILLLAAKFHTFGIFQCSEESSGLHFVLFGSLLLTVLYFFMKSESN